jgi:hypothetical protein
MTDSWRARPYAEAHSGKCKKYLIHDPPKGKQVWSVYKGESFDLDGCQESEIYGYAFPDKMAEWLNGARRRRVAGSAYREFSEQWANDPKTAPWLFPRVAYRDVARSTDSRTVIPAIVPPRVFLADTAPYLLFPRGTVADQVYVYGILRSLPLDWFARLFVEKHVKYYIMNSMPIPRPSTDEAGYRRVVQLAGRIAFVNDRFAEWAKKVGVACGPLPDDQKQDHIRELDAVVAHLYGLTEAQLAHAFETFHEGWDYADRLKSTLRHFHAWKDSTP